LNRKVDARKALPIVFGPNPHEPRARRRTTSSARHLSALDIILAFSFSSASPWTALSRRSNGASAKRKMAPSSKGKNNLEKQKSFLFTAYM